MRLPPPPPGRYFTLIWTLVLPGRVEVTVVTRTRWLPTRTVFVVLLVDMAPPFIEKAPARRRLQMTPARTHRGNFGIVLHSMPVERWSAGPRPDKQPRSGPSSYSNVNLPGPNDSHVVIHRREAHMWGSYGASNHNIWPLVRAPCALQPASRLGDVQHPGHQQCEARCLPAIDGRRPSAVRAWLPAGQASDERADDVHDQPGVFFG